MNWFLLSTCIWSIASAYHYIECLKVQQLSKNHIKFPSFSLKSASFQQKNDQLTRTNMLADVLSPSIYPIFEEAVVMNSVQALILILIGQKSLTPQGLLHATILGIGLWTFLGFRGWIICVSYLILGSLATKVKMKEKEKLGIAEKRGGARGPENVWGSAASAMVCAMLTYFIPSADTALKVGYVASIASKLSDTLGSELGKAYGKTTYLVTTMKLVPRGTEGAVSLEGTLSGIIGSILLAYVSFLVGILPDIKSVVICVVAAFIATTAESFIGAVFQDSIKWLNNELVNLIMTVIGAVVGIALYSWIP